MVHHTNPALTVLEVSAETDNLLFEQEGLVKLTQTWNVETVVPDEALIKTEQQDSIKLLNFEQELPEDVTKDGYDILVASDTALNFYGDNVVNAVGRMCEVVKQDGTLCFLAKDSTLISIQPALLSNNMQTNVFHSVDGGLGLVIAKKADASGANGVSNGLTNGTNGATAAPEVTILLSRNPTEKSLSVASKLVNRLQENHYEAPVFSWGQDVSALAGKTCISLLEFEKPLLRNLASADFLSLKKVILETNSLFWVTALDDPGNAMIDGLVRVIRNETPGLNVRILHADDPSALAAPVELLAGLVVKAFLSTGEDNEFKVKDDILQICRSHEDTVLNEEINSLLPEATKTITQVPLGQIEYPVKLCVPSPGNLSSVCLELDPSAEEELKPDFVEIQTKASALK